MAKKKQARLGRNQKTCNIPKKYLSVFHPKYGSWSMIEKCTIVTTFETQNFGWAVIVLPDGKRQIVCTG